jgi:hypothetical protein
MDPKNKVSNNWPPQSSTLFTTPTPPDHAEPTARTPHEQELFSKLPNRELVDELVEIYFHSDVCHATFRPVFNQSYQKLWNTRSDHTINIPFLGVLFMAMACAIQCHPDASDDSPNGESAKKAVDMYTSLASHIVEDPRYNIHVETVETVILQGVFLLNEVPSLPSTYTG